MASASTKSSRLETLNSEYASPIRRRLNVGNMIGIKNDKDWPMYDYSYFLIPGNGDQTIDPKEIDPADFVQFWNQVPRSQKLCRLLLDYVCVTRILFRKPEMATPPDLVACLLSAMDDDFREIFHRFVLQVIGGDPGGYLDLVQNGFRLEENTNRARSVLLDDTLQSREEVVRAMSNGFLEMYAGWKASPDPTRYLKKLRMAVPHWSIEERKWLSSFMQAATIPGLAETYVGFLMRSEGLGKFKLIAFGKEKFCANCGQSSYMAKDRLWTCKLCVAEHVRHKARYCNVDCQKAHWVKHKAEMHSSCGSCGRKATESQTKLRACTKCLQENPNGAVRYCDEKCQRAHWPDHKKMHPKKEKGALKKM